MNHFSHISQKNYDTKDELTQHWSNFIRGDDDAFSKLYERLVRELFSFGTTFTADRELVKDCIQDVFFRIYQNRAQLTSVDNIKLYFLITLKNLLIDTFRKQQNYNKFLAVYDAEESLDDSQEERLIEQESHVFLHSQTEKYKSVLTMRQQEIIHYRFVDDLSIEEISKLLNINYQSVANIIQRSLKKIRKIYLKK